MEIYSKYSISESHFSLLPKIPLFSFYVETPLYAEASDVVIGCPRDFFLICILG